LAIANIPKVHPNLARAGGKKSRALQYMNQETRKAFAQLVKEFHAQVTQLGEVDFPQTWMDGFLNSFGPLILIRRRKACPYGQWYPWLKANVRFSHETARKYINLYRHRDQIKSMVAMVRS
jgi:hypothetical protein